LLQSIPPQGPQGLSEQMPSNKIYFENLDGFRFLLALIVFSSHSELYHVLTKIFPFPVLDRVFATLCNGFYGVSSFFVLSGFLISYLMIDENVTLGKFDLKNFYVRRIFRIWPLYYSVLFFSFFVYPWVKTHLGFEDQNPFNFLYQFFFCSNFDSIRVQHNNLMDYAPMMININWSISIEEQFYVVWPMLFLLFGWRNFGKVCLAIIFISLGYRFVTYDSAATYYHTLSVISDLGIGSLLACLCYFNRSFVKAIEQLPKALVIGIYVIGFAFLAYSYQLLPDRFNIVWLRIILASFVSFIIAEQCYARHSFYKFSNFRFFSKMGIYTYGLYMLHPIGIQVCIILFRFISIDRNASIFNSALYALLSFIFSMILALLSYVLLEKRFLSLRKKYYS
jgi:peptidoglycan/LPS O-acetylase OafA/YrhL